MGRALPLNNPPHTHKVWGNFRWFRCFSSALAAGWDRDSKTSGIGSFWGERSNFFTTREKITPFSSSLQPHLGKKGGKISPRVPAESHRAPKSPRRCPKTPQNDPNPLKGSKNTPRAPSPLREAPKRPQIPSEMPENPSEGLESPQGCPRAPQRDPNSLRNIPKTLKGPRIPSEMPQNLSKSPKSP